MTNSLEHEYLLGLQGPHYLQSPQYLLEQGHHVAWVALGRVGHVAALSLALLEMHAALAARLHRRVKRERERDCVAR